MRDPGRRPNWYGATMHQSMGSGRFTAGAAIREAWQQIIGSRRTYLYMSITVALVTWLVGTVLLGWLLPPAEPTMVTLPNGEVVLVEPGSESAFDFSVGADWMSATATTAYPWIEQIVGAALSALFAGAFAAYALRRAADLPVRFSMLTDYFRFFPTFLLLGLLAFAALFVLIRAGPIVILLATLAGSVAFAFANLFVVDREAGVVEEVQGSWNIVRDNLGQTILLLLAGAVLAVLVSLPVGLSTAFLPSAVTAVAVIATAIASMLLTALMSVALACAFRDAVGIHTAGEVLPLERGAEGAVA